jgi:hypothetical protein
MNSPPRRADLRVLVVRRVAGRGTGTGAVVVPDRVGVLSDVPPPVIGRTVVNVVARDRHQVVAPGIATVFSWLKRPIRGVDTPFDVVPTVTPAC